MRQQVRSRVQQWILLAVACGSVVGFAKTVHGTAFDDPEALRVTNPVNDVSLVHRPVFLPNGAEDEASFAKEEMSVSVHDVASEGAEDVTAHGGVTQESSPEESMVCGFESDMLQQSIDGEDAPEPAALKVFCLKPEHGAPCSNRCIASGVGCAPMHTHPYKANAGWGRLFACNTLFIGHMCSYHFSNGDDCFVAFSSPIPTLCSYSGDG